MWIMWWLGVVIRMKRVGSIRVWVKRGLGVEIRIMWEVVVVIMIMRMMRVKGVGIWVSWGLGVVTLLPLDHGSKNKNKHGM